MTSSQANELRPADLEGSSMKEVLASLRTCDVGHAMSSKLYAFLEYVAASVDAGKRVVAFHEEEEFTPAQAAEVLGVSRSYVSRLIRNGRIAANKVGAHNRIPLSELLAVQRSRRALDKVLASGQEIDNYLET